MSYEHAKERDNNIVIIPKVPVIANLYDVDCHRYGSDGIVAARRVSRINITVAPTLFVAEYIIVFTSCFPCPADYRLSNTDFDRSVIILRSTGNSARIKREILHIGCIKRRGNKRPIALLTVNRVYPSPPRQLCLIYL